MSIPYGIAYWHDRKSRNGISGDVLNSMLQKSIRRGEEDSALAAACEMYITSPDYLEMLWQRLMCISVEDIGFGDPYASRLVRTLNEIRREFPYADGDQPLFFVHAVRYLCRSRKERTSDHMRGMLKSVFQSGYIPQVPEYAYDIHTTKGREMGRDMVHFAEEASRVEPRLEDPQVQRIHEEFVAFCKREGDMDGVPETEAFAPNCWQY